MPFADLFKLTDEKEWVLFKSYWVHTILQFVVVAFFLWQENRNMIFILILLLGSAPLVIMYVSFQFPITGFLIVLAHRIKARLLKQQNVFVHLFFSIITFVLLASLVLYFFFTIFSFFYIKNPSVLENLILVVTYFTPVFFVGELFRQRFVLKKIYDEKV